MIRTNKFNELICVTEMDINEKNSNLSLRFETILTQEEIETVYRHRQLYYRELDIVNKLENYLTEKQFKIYNDMDTYTQEKFIEQAAIEMIYIMNNDDIGWVTACGIAIKKIASEHRILGKL